MSMGIATCGRMKLVQKIEHLMDQRGLKQSELAPMIGVTPQRLNLWLKGTGHPKPQVLLRMARVFDVDIEYLLDDALDVPIHREPVSDEESKLLWAIRTLGLQVGAVLKLIVPASEQAAQQEPPAPRSPSVGHAVKPRPKPPAVNKRGKRTG